MFMFKILMNNDPISAPLYPIKEWPPFLYIDFIYTPVYFPPPPIKTIPNHTVEGSLSRLYCYRIWSNHWPLHWASTIGVICRHTRKDSRLYSCVLKWFEMMMMMICVCAASWTQNLGPAGRPAPHLLWSLAAEKLFNPRHP
jgi:hypothetical protein